MVSVSLEESNIDFFIFFKGGVFDLNHVGLSFLDYFTA